MPNELRVRTSAPGAGKASSDIDKLRDKFDKLQKQGAKGFAIGAGAAVTTAGLGLIEGAAESVVGALGTAIQAGSDLNESLGKSQVVFGDSAKEIEAWADTAATAFGLSKQQALEAAGTYGNLFQAFGVGADQSAAMSKSLVQLAADLASFNNTSVDDALLALRSGLSGETEPLKRYGIALSDARLRQELMSKGAKNLGATLTPLQKSTAAYALIMHDSALAQGDFGRTASGLANQQRILAARLADTSAEIGQKLVPAAIKFNEIALDLLDTFDKLGSKPEEGLLDIARAFGLIAGNSTLAGGAVKTATEEIDKSREAAHALKYMADASKDDLIPALDGVAGAAGDATDEAAKLKDEFLKTRAAANDLTDELKLLEGAMFGQDVLAGQIAQAQQDLQDILKEGPGSKAPGAWTIWNGKVAEARQRLFDLEYQQKQTEGPAALQAWLLKQRDAMDQADTKALAYIDTLLRLNGVLAGLGRSANLTKDDLYVPPKPTSKPPPSGTPIKGPRAAGGPVAAGMPYLVGEQGPEIVVPSAAATVVPNEAIGGVSVTITGPMHFNGIGSNVSPQAAGQFGKAVADAVATELREQNARTGRRR